MSYIMNTQIVLIRSRKFMGLETAVYFDTKNDTAFSFQKVLVSFGNQPFKYMGSFKYINSFVSLSVDI